MRRYGHQNRPGARSPRPLGEAKPTDDQLEASEEVLALQAGLLTGVPDDDPYERSDDEQARWLLAQPSREQALLVGVLLAL